MFRINLATFRRPDSGYSKLAHTLIALAYRAYVIRRFYPGSAEQKLNEETGDLIAKSNAFVLDHILKMYSVTAGMVTKKDLDELAASIRTGCRGLVKEADQITTRMDRLQQAERKFRQAGVPDEVQHSSLLRKIFRV